jgi:hypothetical protein
MKNERKPMTKIEYKIGKSKRRGTREHAVV